MRTMLMSVFPASASEYPNMHHSPALGASMLPGACARDRSSDFAIACAGVGIANQQQSESAAWAMLLCRYALVWGCSAKHNPQR